MLIIPTGLRFSDIEPINFGECCERGERSHCINDLLQRCVEEGLLRSDATSDTSFALLVGPFMMSSLLGIAKVDESFADTVIDHFIEGLRARVTA